MIFCDSSFLIVLLVAKDYFHRAATSHAVSFTESIPLTQLAELEVTNIFCSLDLRQRDLAKAAGLKLLPLRMPK